MLTKTLKKMEVTRGFINIPNEKRVELLGNVKTPLQTKLNGHPARVDAYGRLWAIDYLKNRFTTNMKVTITKNEGGFQIVPSDQKDETLVSESVQEAQTCLTNDCARQRYANSIVVNGNGETQDVVFREMIQLPSTTYATFGLYRYPAKFIPHVIAYVLQQYAEPQMKVFDPFGGSGTVGIMSRLYGNDYELWDLNPIIETLHEIAIMKPVNINLNEVTEQMFSYGEEFVPRWSRHQYWFPNDFLPFLYKVWGYYHSLSDRDLKLTLTVPLLKTTRNFSYDDQQRQKLTMSTKSKDHINRLLLKDWKMQFIRQFSNEVNKVLKAQREYCQLSPKNVKGVVKGGIDTLHEELQEKKDILVTSPPYLQSQEYIRQAKLDLFWLGYPEDKIKILGKMEIPYRNISPCPIYSKTFSEYENSINEPHIKKVFDNYFWGIIGSLTRLQKNITAYMFLFVGHSSTRGKATPIDKILVEHFTNLGWLHKATLMDKIVTRRMFSYRVNPATGIKDTRTPVENLVILQRE
jgi:DNA modification methylase